MGVISTSLTANAPEGSIIDFLRYAYRNGLCFLVEGVGYRGLVQEFSIHRTENIFNLDLGTIDLFLLLLYVVDVVLVIRLIDDPLLPILQICQRLIKISCLALGSQDFIITLFDHLNILRKIARRC